MTNNDFNKKLLEKQNPFPYPHPPEKPSFVIGGDQYLKWLKKVYTNTTKQEGTSGIFLVGRPGAGKTHLLRHLKHLFYECGDYKGVYTMHTLSDLDINEAEREIWRELFWSQDSASRLTSLISKGKIESAMIRPDIKSNLMKLIDQNLGDETRISLMRSLTTGEIRRLAEHISKLLPEGSILCFALDNVEEYVGEREDYNDTRVHSLFQKIRNMTSTLKRALVILAITDEAWAKVKTAEPARTKARRFRFAEEEMLLRELTLPECYNLVKRNMESWCDRNNLTLPQDNKECLCSIDSENFSIYPFTPLAIEMARRVTDGLAGDITCFCSECINEMGDRGKVDVVKGNLIIDNLKRLAKERKWLGWAPKLEEELRELGPVIRRDALIGRLTHLTENAREKYKEGLDTETIAGNIDRFAEILGVMVSPSPSVPNSYNPTAHPIESSAILRMWQFQDTKIAMRYVIGERRWHIPTIKMYGKKVSRKDYVAITSLIDGKEATHGLMIRLWTVNDRYSGMNGFTRSLAEFGSTIMHLDINYEDPRDDNLFRIVAVAELAAAEEQRNLARLVDHFFVKLTPTLRVLVQQQRPERKLGEPPKTEKYTRHY